MAKELPFFKFTANEWLTGDIYFEDFDIQGLFSSVCATYWSKDCNITLTKLKQRLSNAKANQWQRLVDGGYIKVDDDNVSISFLDEQIQELSAQRMKKVEAGRKGGKASVKQRLSNAKASVKHKDIDIEVDKDIEVEIDKHKMCLWLEETYPKIQKMENPLTDKEAERIKNDFDSDFIVELFGEMQNKKDLLKRYNSANLTFRSWARLNDRYKKWQEQNGKVKIKMNLGK